MTEFLLELSL